MLVLRRLPGSRLLHSAAELRGPRSVSSLRQSSHLKPPLLGVQASRLPSVLAVIAATYIAGTSYES